MSIPNFIGASYDKTLLRITQDGEDPPGGVIGWNGDRIPDGYMEYPHGEYLSRLDFPTLAPWFREFTGWFRWYIGRQFFVPDLRGKVLRG